MTTSAAWLLFRAAIAMGLRGAAAIHHVAAEAYRKGYDAGRAAQPYRGPNVH